MTLRAVGARAGVSRGAPYGHFAGKDDLLRQLAVDFWDALAGEVERLREADASPGVHLERALGALIALGRRYPHRYALMFATPADAPEAAEAAHRLEGRFLDIVADLAGPDSARRWGALLMASAHGIVGLDLSGHLAEEKWGVGTDELVRTLIAAIPERPL